MPSPTRVAAWPALVSKAAKLMMAIYNAFVATDASLVEINPLVTTESGDVLALDAKMNFDDNALFRHPEIRELRDLSEEDPLEIDEVKQLVQRHAEYTRSQRALKLLVLWDDYVPKFVKVMPRDYKRVLQAMKRITQAGLSGDEAWMAAFEANARDGARIGGG